MGFRPEILRGKIQGKTGTRENRNPDRIRKIKMVIDAGQT